MTRGFLVPHVPFLLPELGGNKLRPFINDFCNSINHLREELADDPPDFILTTSPHFMVSTFAVGINRSFQGSLDNFNRPDLVDIRKSKENIAEQIQKNAEDIGFIAERTNETISTIDYGTVVALKLLDPTGKIPIIPVSTSLGTKKEHLLWGARLFDIVNDMTDNAMMLATTELTQDFQEIPNAYPSEREQDEAFLDHLIKHRDHQMLNMNENYYQKTENSLKPVFTLSGFVKPLTGYLLNYSGIIGCGCAIVKFEG